MSEFQPCTYIMASGRRGYIYIGVTSNLLQRMQQHRDRLIDGYSKNRNTVHLVRFELFGANGASYWPREAAEKLASGLEIQSGRERQSGLA